MKNNKLIVLICMTVAVALFGAIPEAFVQEKAKPESAPKEMKALTIVRLVAGTGVENREPVGVAETFPASTEKVYCFLEAADIAKDTEVSFVWFHGEKERLKLNLPVQAGSRWRTYAHKNLQGLKGEWRVEIRDSNGSLLKEIKFKVE